MRKIAEEVDGAPWMVAGDFNIYAAENERAGRGHCSRRKQREIHDFVETITDCQLVEPVTDGVRFTWERGGLFEKLDRVLLGEGWTSIYQTTRVTNMARILSDHSPVLVRCGMDSYSSKPPFRFQHMWVRHKDFLKEIKDLWDAETDMRGMRKLHYKLVNVKRGLKVWNREVFGDIFSRVKQAGERATKAQIEFENQPTPEKRSENNRAMAEFILALRMEEDFWRQKASIRWVAEGERNTKYFQGMVKQKRLKTKIFEFKDEDEIITSEEELRKSAAKFFQTLLSSEGSIIDINLIHSLPHYIDVDNLCVAPSMEEVKQAVFDISADSTPGPDGFSALFYQIAWDIIGKDVTEAVEDFFGGAYMPRSFTSTMLILLPKKTTTETWADFRPISLCNTSNKIISKIIAK